MKQKIKLYIIFVMIITSYSNLMRIIARAPCRIHKLQIYHVPLDCHS